MLKKIASILLIVSLLLTMQISFAAPAEYTPGDIMVDFTFENPLSVNGATVNGSKIDISAGGGAVYDLLLRAIQVKAEISYNASEDVNLTLKTEDDEQNILLLAEETLKTIDIGWYKGSHILAVSADKNVTLNKITFSKEPRKTSKSNTIITKYNDYNSALQTTVVIKTGAVGIKVDGAMRYVDYENAMVTPEVIDGRIYLPIKTAARAFSLYYEDYTDLSYAYLSNDNFEFYSGENGQYAVINGVKKNVDSFVVYKNGKTWIPVRDLAEMLGLTVAYKDGYVIIDDRICVKNIIESDTLLNGIKSEFEKFDVANRISGKTYHVSKAAYASDANDGSEKFPFATIQKAADIAEAGDTVIIHKGVYREEVVPKNSGTATSPIIFKAADGENVTISAFEEQSGFVPYKDGIYQTIIPKSLGVDRNFIIYNDKIIREGRHPNSDTSTTNQVRADYTDDVMRATIGDIKIIGDDKSVAISDTDLNQEEKDYWKGGTYTSLCGWAWTLSYGIITGSEKGKITFTDEAKVRNGSYGFFYYDEAHPNDYGFITNHLNTVDMPGEWYINDESKILYIMLPKEANPDTFTVEIKQRQRVVDLRNKKYIQFVDINTRGGGITMAGDSEMCVVNGGTHKYISHAGLSIAPATHNWRLYDYPNQWDGIDDAPEFGEAGFMEGGVNNAFINTIIDYSAGAGLYLAGKYCYVENNLISHTGYAGVYTSGITIDTKKYADDYTKPMGGHTVVNNTSYGSSRAAFYISRNWPSEQAKKDLNPVSPLIACDVGYNHFYDANVMSRDSGVVYFYGITAGNDWSRTQLHHNIVHDNVSDREGSALQTILYHDGMSTMFDTYSNILWTKDENYVTTGQKGMLFVQTGDYLSQTEAWGNNIKNVYTGTKEELTVNDFPYAHPYYAGAFSENNQRFMMNYNRLGAKEKYYVNQAELSGNAIIDSNNFGTIPDDTSALTFKDVNVYSDGTYVEIAYTSDRFRFNWDSVENIHLEVDSNGENLATFTRGLFRQNFYKDDLVTEKFLIKGTDVNKGNIRISLKNATGSTKIAYVRTYPADYDVEVVTMPYEPDADIIYFGEYDECLSGNGGTGIKTSTDDAMVTDGRHFYINNTWNNVYLFKNREFSDDASKLTLRIGGAKGYAQTTVEIRVDSPNSEPVATYDVYSYFADMDIDPHKWLDWKVDIDLSKVISKGTHDIYVRYAPQAVKPGISVEALGTTNSYYMAFN